MTDQSKRRTLKLGIVNGLLIAPYLNLFQYWSKLKDVREWECYFFPIVYFLAIIQTLVAFVSSHTTYRKSYIYFTGVVKELTKEFMNILVYSINNISFFQKLKADC